VWVLLIDILKGWIAVRGMALFAFEPRITGEAAQAVLTTYHNWETWEFFVKPACAIAVIVGHLYPVWFGFRGGKGVATLVGVIMALNPLLLLPLLLTWLVAVMVFGYVGLASMIATVSIPVAALLGMNSFTGPSREGPQEYFRALELIPGDPVPFMVRVQAMFWPRDLQLLIFGCAAVVIVVFSHRSNIARMRAGTEPRVRKLWLFRGKRT
jgi:glycerol-3-phosphate acyltransferase PlsY